MELDAFLTYLGESSATGQLAGELQSVLRATGVLAVVSTQDSRVRPGAAHFGSAA